MALRSRWWSQVFRWGSGDLLPEVSSQVTVAANAAAVGVAAGDEGRVEVEQCRSAVAWEAGEPGGRGETFREKGVEREEEKLVLQQPSHVSESCQDTPNTRFTPSRMDPHRCYWGADVTWLVWGSWKT